MAEGLRLLELKKGFKEGQEYNVKIFSPGLQLVLDAQIHIGPKKNIDLLGRVVLLTEVVTKMSEPGSAEIINTSYVDENARALKSIMPVAGMQVEIIACPKDFALGENDILDVTNKMFLDSPQPLENLSSAESIGYHLIPLQKQDKLIIPQSDSQKIQQLEDGSVIVVVKKLQMPTGAKIRYRGKDKQILELARPSSYVQSDDELIVELAGKAVGDTKDAAVAAGKIESFVAKYIDNKNLSIGYASAVEVAQSRQGDCSEFAVLTAAMCRAVGIPARVVVGLAYVKNFAGLEDRFGGHAWVEVYIAGKWIGLDASFKSSGLGGFDAGHIALASGKGQPGDFFQLAATLGKFKIEKIMLNKAR